MSIVPIIIVLLIVMQAGNLGLFYYFWERLQQSKEPVDPVAVQGTSHDDILVDLDERLYILECISQENEHCVQRMVNRVNDLTRIQANQTLEIKRLLRREHAPLRFGIEPRSPELLSSPTPDPHALLGGLHAQQSRFDP